MHQCGYLNSWRLFFSKIRVCLVAKYLWLLPILFFLNSHIILLKIYLIGCVLLTIWLWKTNALGPIPSLIKVSWGSLFYSAVVIVAGFILTSGGSGQDTIRYLYKILFVAGFMGACYLLIIRYGVGDFLRVLKACAIMGCLLSIGAFFIPHPSSFFEGERLLPIGLLHHPILGASVYGMVGVIGFYNMFVLKKTSRILLEAGLFCLCTVLIVLTQSRGPLLAYGVSLFSLVGYFLVYKPYAFKKERAVILWGIIGASFLAGLLINYLMDGVLLKILWAKGDSYRLQIWRETWISVERTFPWGAGYQEELAIKLTAKSTVNHPHNLFLSKLYREGLIGFALLLFMVSLAFQKMREIWRTPEGGLASILFIHGVLSCLTDTSSLWDGKNYEMILFFWFPLVFVASVEGEKKCP